MSMPPAQAGHVWAGWEVCLFVEPRKRAVGWGKKLATSKWAVQRTNGSLRPLCILKDILTLSCSSICSSIYSPMEYSLSTFWECSEPEALTMSHTSSILDTYGPHPVCQSSTRPFFYLNQVESFEYYAHSVLFLNSPIMQIASNVMINWRRSWQPMTWIGNPCPRRIPWTEESGGLRSIGLQRVRHGWSGLAHDDQLDNGYQCNMEVKDEFSKIAAAEHREDPRE